MRRRALPRVFKVLALSLSGMVIVSVLLVAGALTLARTAWGAERIRRFALPRVNAALAGGQVDVRRLGVAGNRIVVEGLTLRDPDGDLVARVVRVEVVFSPLALLRHRLELRTVTLDQPSLLVREDSTGETNLARALATKGSDASPRTRPSGSSAGPDRDTQGLSVELHTLAIRGGVVDLRDERAATAPSLRHMRIVDVVVQAGGRYDGGDGAFTARLDLRGDATEPLQEPLVLLVSGQGVLRDQRPNGGAVVEVGVGDSGAHLTAAVASAPRPTPQAQARPAATGPIVHATVDLDRARVLPALMRLLVPSSPIKAALTASGHATWNGATHMAAVWAKLGAANTTVAATASVDLQRRSIEGLSVRAQGIDLARLMTDGPLSDLSFSLDAHGRGQTLADLRGAATFAMPRGRLGGYAIGPVRLRANADHGRYKVMDLLAIMPGFRITGAGEARSDTVAFRGAVDLRDLGVAVSSVTAGKSYGQPRATGRGRVDIALAGSPRAPSLEVKGRLVALTWQDIHVPLLEVKAHVPDLRTPAASTVNLNLPELEIGARRFRGVAVAMNAAGPRLDVQASLEAPEALRLDVGGVWARDRSEIAFDRMTLVSRAATWSLARSATLRFRGERLRLEGLDLRTAGAQQIRIDLEKTARSLRADVVLSAIDLARLPTSLLPPKLKLAGRLDAEIGINGPAGRPTVRARVSLADARVGDLRDIVLATDVRLADRRVSGQLDLGALGSKLSGSFDLPVTWPPPAAAPLAIDLDVSNVDLDRVATALRGAQAQLSTGASTFAIKKPLTDVRGMVSCRAKLTGTGASPRMRLDAEVRQLTLNGTRAGDITLGLNAPDSKDITARFELRPTAGADGLPAAGPGVVVVQAGLSLRALIHQPLAPAQLLSTPMNVEAHLARVRLAPLAALAGYPRKVSGTASLDLAFQGTARSARGKLALGFAGVSTGRFPATDAVFHVDLGAHDVRADALVSRRAAPLFAATLRVDAPAARLRDRAAIADVPIQLHAVLGPLDLQRVGLPPETDRRPARILKGSLHAQADLTGTLRAPRLSFRADAVDIRIDQTPLGSGVALLTYADRKLGGDVTVVSANGGRLHVVGSTNANLGYPPIADGADPRQMVVSARLDAKGFDVSGLSGATPGLRSVAGQLFAGVDVTGTAADPRVAGRVEWKDGGLTVTGMGDYKRVHLLAHGDKDHVVLDELRAESGGGHARVTATGDHRSDGGYAIKSMVELANFPAYVEGQALATVSLRASADARVSVKEVRGKIAVSSARLALSDAKRKHLQRLARPGDVVLTDDGEPLNPAQARKLATVTAVLAAGAAPAAAAKSRPPSRPAAAPPVAATDPAGVVLLVDAPRNLWVSGEDANMELGLLPGFRVEISDVARVYGQVIIKRGRLDVVGRRFDLKADSSLRFAGPPDTPELDVSANHVNEKEHITVLVTVRGSPGHLQIDIRAPDRPDLTESQLYTLIVTGRLDLGGGTASSTTPADRAASLVGGLMAAQLQKGLAKKLPFDVLTIEAGGLEAARLEAGTYVTSDLYVGYVGQMGADPALLQNRNAVHLEYQLGARWSFQGEYGDAKTGSADVMWTKRY